MRKIDSQPLAAAENGRAEFVRALLAAGANPAAVDANGKTASAYACLTWTR